MHYERRGLAFDPERGPDLSVNHENYKVPAGMWFQGATGLCDRGRLVLHWLQNTMGDNLSMVTVEDVIGFFSCQESIKRSTGCRSPVTVGHAPAMQEKQELFCSVPEGHRCSIVSPQESMGFQGMSLADQMPAGMTAQQLQRKLGYVAMTSLGGRGFHVQTAACAFVSSVMIQGPPALPLQS